VRPEAVPSSRRSRSPRRSTRSTSVTVSKPDTYEIKVTNKGTIAHALEIEGNGVEEKTGDVQPGAGETLRIKLAKDGSYDLYCPIDVHRGQA
jgi:uncharacterized cupredoxin-like copper-binding protein